MATILHDSDCAVHNAPALPTGPCSCGAHELMCVGDPKALAALRETARQLGSAEWVLTNAGFRRCDTPACNCGSWHQVGGYKQRFDEIKEVVEEAGYSTNGRTLLDAVKHALADKN